METPLCVENNMADQYGLQFSGFEYSSGKETNGCGSGTNVQSPRSRSKAKSILWLKNMLQSYGCIVFDNDRGSNVIDDCFQTPLPTLQKFNPSLVLENHRQSILSTLKFKNLFESISALRSEYVMRIVKPILQKLMSHDRNRNAFNQPVNPEELGIPQYFSVIKRPMDLGTVMSKLRGGQYHSVQTCFEDIKLVFNNAMYFNPWPHDIHKMAKDLMVEFRTEVAQAEEKCLKEKEKRKQHSCSLCSGETCGLCGEKCLKFEAPSLNCQQCGSRIKKNGIFYVCTDGSALWCQKCYVSLPSVIVAGAPRPLHAIDSTAVSPEGTSESAAEVSSFPVSICEESAHTAVETDNGAIGEGGESATAGILDPSCAISTCDTDSLIHCPTDLHNSTSVSSHSNSFCSSSSMGDAQLLKKNLLKRRADEEVAEPWVACDSCGHWFHQLCALYSNLGEGSASTRLFCCPYCILLASYHKSEVKLDSCLAETAQCVSPGRGHRRRGSSIGSDEFPVQDACRIPAPMDVDLPRLPCLPAMMCPEPPKSPAVSRLKTGLTVKFESDTLFKNIFEYSELASPTNYRSPQKSDSGDQISIEVTRTAEEELVMTIVDAAVERCVANVSANSSCAGGGLTSEDEHLLDDISVHEACHTSEEKDHSIAHLNPSACEVEEIHMKVDVPHCAYKIDNLPHHHAPTVPVGTPVQDDDHSTAPQTQSLLDAHWKWRASSLPHTQLGDFLENLVRDMLVANGHHAAAHNITIRMTTNRDLPLEVPSSIVKNLVSPSGHCIPECLGYKQKCILLFQEIDGVDVCLFSLYVHEFDANCPSPNTSTVYIAYLDSVDYFRPIAARTMVYQEIVAGYLKWSQARGFRQAHIWSCPPHRGDNFIFNAHPAHQKYPSRERLNHWYKSILSRCTKLGIIAETGNLWQQYFSKYVRRDALPSARQAALKSFVGTGMAVRKSNIKPKKKIGIPAPAAMGQTVDISLPVVTPGDLHQGTSTENILPTSATATADVSTAPALTIDAPVCPPIFDGDYWVQQYIYLVRLHTQKAKGQSNATQRQQLGLRKFRELLKRLMNRDESEPFLHPVDHIALDIPQYALIVKHPMDMNTVKEKLGAAEYPTALEFVRDVRLIFTNAKLFNPANHPVHVAADYLSMKFEKGLTLATTELRETASGGNGLLRMPIPSQQQDSAEEASMDSFLRQIPLAFPVKDPLLQEVQTQLTAAANSDSFESTSRHNTASSSTLCDADKSRVEFVYHTPQCQAVSRSNSLVDEQEFCGAARRVHSKEEGSASPTNRPRTQSISITPTAASCTTPAPTSTALSPRGTITATAERIKVEAVSDSELESDPSLRRMQHVVSQEFVDDQKKKKLNELSTVAEWAIPCSASKRRRLSEDLPRTSLTTERLPSTAPAAGATVDSAALPSQAFSAEALNSSHQAVAFVAPALGSQNTMTIVAELSKRMQRQYDDLFVIKLTPPTSANLFNDAPSAAVSDSHAASASVKTTSAASVQASSKRSRGRVAAHVRRTPAMHVPGGLKCMGAACRKLLSSLTPDTSDPDPAICSPVTDSRHVFLELCQFRHYQFDSLRRAKHSSLMLLYHLQNPTDKSCHAVCNHCDQVICNLRWHCDECPNFDLCAGCYAVDMAHRTGPLCLSNHPSFSADADFAGPIETSQPARVHVRGESALALPHPHTLTPYRISSL